MLQKKLIKASKDQQKTISEMQEMITVLRNAYLQNSQVMAAIVNLLGEESVQAEIDRMAQEKLDATEAQMAAGVKSLIEQGVLEPTSEVAINSLLVGTDLYADGKTRRAQFEVNAQVAPAEIVQQLVGKKVGEGIEHNGVKLTIVEIYTVNTAKIAEMQAAQAKKAAEATEAPKAEVVS